MPAIWASIQRASWLALYQCFCLSVCSHLLSRSHHHHRRHLSSGPPPLRSWSLECWGLRSCRLNCQSLWTSLTCKDVRPLTGGWDTHTHRHTYKHTQRVERGDMPGKGESSRAHTRTHTPGNAFMHDTSMNYLWTCMCISHGQCGQDKDKQTTQTQQQGQKVSVTQG